MLRKRRARKKRESLPEPKVEPDSDDEKTMKPDAVSDSPEPGSTTQAPPGAATPSRSSQKILICIGCGRQADLSTAVHCDDVVAWAHSPPKGCWCLSCHTTWRTCLRERVPLANMKDRLSVRIDELVDFLWLVVAFE